MQDALDRVLAALAAHHCEAKRSGEGWSSLCPHHEDHRPSLMTSQGEKAVVMHCHVGCRTEDILGDIGLTMKDLFDDAPVSRKGDIEATYAYRNEQGVMEWEQVRFAGKQFRSRRPDGAGGWEWKKGRSMLYRLPELLFEISLGSTIFVCEGEKDADAIVAAGGVATCNPGGAGKWRPEFGKILDKATHVRIVADKDQAGYAHAADVAASLNGASYEIVVAREGKDAADHLVRYGLEDFVELVWPEPEAEPEPEVEPEPDVDFMEIAMARDFRMERTDWLLDFTGFIPLGMTCLIAGLPGEGKSLLGCYLAARASRRGERVLIAAAEDSVSHTLLKYLTIMDFDPDYVGFAVYKRRRKGREFVGGLKLPEHEPVIRAGIETYRPRLVIIDPIASFMGSEVNIWKDTDVRDALDPLTIMAEENDMAIVMLAHLNKNKGTGASFLDRVSNSGAFGQVVRSAMLWARDPDDPESAEEGYHRLLISDKINVGQKPNAKRFLITPTSVHDDDGEQHGTARMECIGESKRTTADVLGRRQEKPPGPAVAAAMIMLRETLQDGQLSAAEIEERRKAWPDPISPATLYRAAERIGVEHVQLGFQQGTAWKLPS